MILAPLLALAAGTAAADKTPAAARAVVERYYAAIDHRRFPDAYHLWDRRGRASGRTLRSFAAGFAHTRSTHVVTAAPSGAEGAAGSSFVTVPVRVEALLTDGTRQRFVGTYVLRRVNDVDGATAEQLRWHIASATMRLVR